MFKKVKYTFSVTILKIITKALPFLFNKNKKTVLFGAMYGLYFADNSSHMYTWVLENRKEIKAVWFTRNKQLFHEMKSKKLPVVLIGSIKALVLLLTAKCALFSNSLKDFNDDPFLIKANINLIALRHGRSVKKVRFARETHQLPEAEKKERLHEGRLIKYAVSTSEFISDIQEKCLLIGRHKHVVTGLPRNDFLLSPPNSARKVWNKFIGDNKARKVILYAPTWRHGRECTKFFPFQDFSLTRLVSMIENHNLLLLLRPHKNDLRRYSEIREYLHEMEAASSNIRKATHDIFPDINTILPFVDIMVTDYSAIFHDFLLLNKPLLFIPYDYETFNNQNGFLYDYFSNIPGPAVRTFDEFCMHIEALVTGHDSYLNKRIELNNKINTYKDGDSCRRVAKLIDTILYE